MMTPDALRSTNWLLQQLADPFAIFPLQDVARSLTDSIAESKEAFRELEGPSGVSRKYWDVPMELLDEGIGVAIGSAFVLGQAAIVQTESIVARLRMVSNGHAAIPGKKALLETETMPSLTKELSDMVVINTAANYFKHYYEWPENWQDSTDIGTGVQRRSMTAARLLGMRGHDLTSNMYSALTALKIGADKVFTVPMTVHDWRERLATKLSKDLGLPPSDCYDS